MIRRSKPLCAALFLAFSLCACAPTTKQPDILPPVKVAFVRSGSLTRTIPIHGTLSPLPNHEVVIRPPFAGTVSQVLAAPNQEIKKGEIVAYLSTQLLVDELKGARADFSSAGAQEGEAETGFQAAQAAVANAEANMKRERKLFSDGIVSLKDVQDAKLAEEEANAAAAAKKEEIAAATERVKGARAVLSNTQTKLSLSVIRAPISGTVAQVSASSGEVVSPSDALLTIVDTRRLQLVAAVQSRDLPGVRVGERVRFSTPSLPEESFTGVVAGISPQVDPSSGAIPVTVRLDNKSSLLKDDMVATGEILTGNERGLLVPESAILTDPATQKTTIMIVDKNDVVRVVPVKVRFSSGNKAEIAGDVREGERVAVEGEYALPGGTKVNPVQVAKQ